MRYLLDTHVWLWLATRPERIRPELLDELSREQTGLVFSAVSSWEIAIKWAAGRLELPEPPAKYVPRTMRQSKAVSLAVEHTHALQVATMPRHHRDPFDRLLIAQSQIESIPIVTGDAAFDAYDVEIVRP